MFAELLQEPQKHVCSHFWSHVNKLISSAKNFQKNVSSFDAISSQTRQLWEGGTIFDWSTLPECSSRNNSNLTKLFSLEGDRFKSSCCSFICQLRGATSREDVSSLDRGSLHCRTSGDQKRCKAFPIQQFKCLNCDD